jgi:GNAT superfamily N-acetyltransferase
MQSTAITIRSASEADVPLILQFITALARYEHLVHTMTATEELLRKHLFGETPVAQVLIASLADKEVGFALYFQSFSTFVGKPGIYLEDLFVNPPARGKGVGRALLLEVARIALERECGRLEWAVLDWNESAIRFYKKLGAIPMADWTTYRVTGDALTRLARGKST